MPLRRLLAIPNATNDWIYFYEVYAFKDAAYRMRNAPLLEIGRSRARFRELRTRRELRRHVYGEIKLGDENIFDALTPDCNGGGVLLKSDGGSLAAGLRIGELIREKGLETAVAFDARCASACALAWLGGTKRYMSASSQIGFHAAYTVNDLGTPNESGLGSPKIRSDLRRVGKAERDELAVIG